MDFLDIVYDRALKRVHNVELAIERGIEVDDDVIYLQKKIVEDDLMGFFNSMVAKDSEDDTEMQQYFRNQIDAIRDFDGNPGECKGILKDQFIKISQLETTLNYARSEHYKDVQSMRRLLMLAQNRIDELETKHSFLP